MGKGKEKIAFLTKDPPPTRKREIVSEMIDSKMTMLGSYLAFKKLKEMEKET